MNIAHPPYTISNQEATWIDKNLKRDAFSWVAVSTIWSILLFFAVRSIWVEVKPHETVIMAICISIILSPSVALFVGALINLFHRNNTHFHYTTAKIEKLTHQPGIRKDHYYADIVLGNGMKLSNISINQDIFYSKAQSLIVVLREQNYRYLFDANLKGWTTLQWPH